MRKYLCDEYKTVALLGSFGKHYDLMTQVAKKLNNIRNFVKKG